MGGGGKGGSQSTEVKIPKWLENEARQNIGIARDVAAIGPVMNPGPTVAAFTPAQQAAFEMTGANAQAFGMMPQGMTPQQMRYAPAPTQYANGVQGYSAAPIREQLVEQFRRTNPGQYDFISGMFIDPQRAGSAPRNSNVRAATSAAAPRPAPSSSSRSSDFVSGRELQRRLRDGEMTQAEVRRQMRRNEKD